MKLSFMYTRSVTEEWRLSTLIEINFSFNTALIPSIRDKIKVLNELQMSYKTNWWIQIIPMVLMFSWIFQNVLQKNAKLIIIYQ